MDLKPSDFIIDCPLIGFCTLDIKVLLKYWNNKCAIYAWDNEYSLRECIWKSGIRTHGEKFKLNIKSEDAQLLISKLKLNKEQGFFKSSSTYRTASSETQYMILEMRSYIKQANKSIRELKRRNKA